MQIIIIILLNILIIVIAQSGVFHTTGSDTLSVQTLSQSGSRGEEVRRIQAKLKEQGYYQGSVDGIYGKETEKAVKAFQKKNGLTTDGVAGTNTLQKLGISASASKNSKENAGDTELLAKIISAEARGEPYTGQVAVGSVILNRVHHPDFPDTISGVVYQPGAFDAVRDKNWSAPIVDSARKAAQEALNGSDPTSGAIYYYNPATSTNKWILSRPVVKKIGLHVFCK